MLSEDHGEVLRQGAFGDEHVAIEDRLITNSLRGYIGAEREQVRRLLRRRPPAYAAVRPSLALGALAIVRAACGSRGNAP